MTDKPNIVDNVRRILAHYGLEHVVAVSPEAVEEDRFYGWPNGHDLLVFMVLNRWPEDPQWAAEHHHGEDCISFREPGNVRPALQVVLHPNRTPQETPYGPYFIEFDCDEGKGVRHGIEVIRNAVTRKKTDQAVIAALLDKRFNPPPEAA
jgi:hypothetical protein